MLYRSFYSPASIKIGEIAKSYLINFTWRFDIDIEQTFRIN